MTHEEVMERVRTEIQNIILQNSGRVLGVASASNQILSIPEILIKDPDQSLPENPYKPKAGEQIRTGRQNLYEQSQQDMLKEHWMRMLPKEEK